MCKYVELLLSLLFLSFNSFTHRVTGYWHCITKPMFVYPANVSVLHVTRFLWLVCKQCIDLTLMCSKNDVAGIFNKCNVMEVCLNAMFVFVFAFAVSKSLPYPKNAHHFDRKFKLKCDLWRTLCLWQDELPNSDLGVFPWKKRISSMTLYVMHMQHAKRSHCWHASLWLMCAYEYAVWKWFAWRFRCFFQVDFKNSNVTVW